MTLRTGKQPAGIPHRRILVSLTRFALTIGEHGTAVARMLPSCYSELSQ